MKEVYAYTRVSTERQGTKGVSLEEQKYAIERYAKQNNLTVIHWFEERVTAAKSGRPAFTNLISFLRAGLAEGVVIHKIDRSARNLKDWAELVDLADQGVEIHFVNESIDMGVRGGRLSADIQAVVAADYIRNLREETIKGLRGRLKQGFYPMRAPVGYLDKGGGKAKAVDPFKGPIIKELFDKYASGEYSLKALLKYAHIRGLTNLSGGKLSLNGLSTILHNRFYTGVIYIQRTGECYAGKHEAIISQKKYDAVQQILSGKRTKGGGKHDYLFRKMFTCTGCKRRLVGEKQKKYIYYRCHNCPGVSIRENVIKASIKEMMINFRLSKDEISEIGKAQRKLLSEDEKRLAKERKALTLEHQTCEDRISKLTDAFIDETIDKVVYLLKKDELITKLQEIKQKLITNAKGVSKEKHDLVRQLERYKTLYLDYENKAPMQKRQVLEELASNRYVSGKNVVIELDFPYSDLGQLKKVENGDPHRGTARTFREKLDKWIKETLSEGGSQSP